MVFTDDIRLDLSQQGPDFRTTENYRFSNWNPSAKRCNRSNIPPLHVLNRRKNLPPEVCKFSQRRQHVYSNSFISCRIMTSSLLNTRSTVDRIGKEIPIILCKFSSKHYRMIILYLKCTEISLNCNQQQVQSHT